MRAGSSTDRAIDTSWARRLVSARSGAESPLRHGPLPVVEAPWLVDYELTPERGEWLLARLSERPWSLWRYRELLPVMGRSPRIELGEGGTPLIRLRRLFPASFETWVKDESLNPTGSFKARGLSLAVNRALELGVRGVRIPSAGNAALAAAAYAAAAGLPCSIALPDDTPAGVAARCRLHGAEVSTGGRTLVEAAQRLADNRDELWDLSTFKEPYRVEGKKTMAFELAEQFRWRLPDWLVYPTGGGTGIVAMAKAFAELGRLGLVDPGRCRFLIVQMAGCAPVVEAWRRGADQAEPCADPSTDVWGLRVPRTLADFLILDAVRRSGGVAVTVPESAVKPMQEAAAKREGLLVGPEGAAALAGLHQLIEQGRVTAGQRVVVFQTGHPANYS